MPEITILIDGNPFHLDDEGMAALRGLRQPRDFHGAEVADAFGVVPITLNGKTWKMRVGNKEWWAAEEQFKPVKGVPAIMDHINRSEKALAQFYKIALSRHHAELTLQEVGDLMDFKPEEGQPSLRDGLERCLQFSRPKVFADDEPDPKAQAALMAAFLAKAATTPKESAATT